MNVNFIIYLILSLIKILKIQCENSIENGNQKNFRHQIQEGYYLTTSSCNIKGNFFSRT